MCACGSLVGGWRDNASGGSLRRRLLPRDPGAAPDHLRISHCGRSGTTPAIREAHRPGQSQYTSFVPRHRTRRLTRIRAYPDPESHLGPDRRDERAAVGRRWCGGLRRHSRGLGPCGPRPPELGCCSSLTPLGPLYAVRREIVRAPVHLPEVCGYSFEAPRRKAAVGTFHHRREKV